MSDIGLSDSVARGIYDLIALPIVSFVAAFLIGSIPFGYVIGRFFYRTDIRARGSGNIGAMNALRTLGKSGAVAVLLFDALKGFVPTTLHAAFGFSTTLTSTSKISRRENEILAATRRDGRGPRPLFFAMASLSRGQGRCDFVRRDLCAELAGRPGCSRRLDLRRRRHALLLGRFDGREHSCAVCTLVFHAFGPRDGLRDFRRAARSLHASGEHRKTARRDRKTDSSFQQSSGS